MSTAAPTFDPAVPEKSSGWMLANLWFDPGGVFRQVARTPRWYVPLLLITVAAMIYLAVFSSHVGWETFIRHEIDSNPRLESMPLEQREKVVEMQMKFAPIFGYVGTATGIATTAAVIAAVLLIVFKYMLGGTCGFGQALGVVSWSMLPGLLHTAAGILVMMLLPPAEFDLKNPVGVNIGYYLGSTSPAWMKSLLTSIDFFSLWTILLLATGMSTVTGKSWGASLVAVLIPWSVYVVIKTGFAAVFG
jgi:hypothetical protein